METETKSNSTYSLPKKQVILIMACTMMAMFLSSLDQTVVATAMPRIITDLHGFNLYTWVTTIYMITSAIATPITGKLSDMFGRKFFLVTGIALFTLGSLACGFSQSMLQIVIFRGIQGIGAGMIMINSYTIPADLFPPLERPKYQGYMASVFGLSSVCGPTLGGYITDTLSWHWIFFINVPLGLFILIMIIYFFPDLHPDKRKHDIDYLGAAFLILTVVPLLLALTWGGSIYPWKSWIIIGLFLFAAVMLVVLVLVERHVAEPILPKELFTNSIILNIDIISFLGAVGQFSLPTFLPLFMQGVLGASATVSGNYLIPMSLGMLIGSFSMGQLLTAMKGHYRVPGIVGSAVACVGIFLLSRINIHTSFLYIVVSSSITTIGCGSLFPIYTVALQNCVPRNMVGAATSTMPFFRVIGGSVGLAVLGSILNNRFTSEFVKRVPDYVKNAVSEQKLFVVSQNPQALVNTGAIPQLKAIIGQTGAQADSMLRDILLALRESLSSSISLIFLISLIFVIAATILNFFLKEIPLRSNDNPPEDNNAKPGDSPEK